MGSDSNQTEAILDDVLSLAEAAQLCGITAHTLAQQAEKGRLRGRKLGHTWVTTRHWIDEYLREHARRRQRVPCRVTARTKAKGSFAGDR